MPGPKESTNYMDEIAQDGSVRTLNFNSYASKYKQSTEVSGTTK